MRTDARDAQGALETRPGQRLHSSHRIALREIINRLRGERVSPRETRNSIMTIQELIDALETMGSNEMDPIQSKYSTVSSSHQIYSA